MHQCLRFSINCLICMKKWKVILDTDTVVFFTVAHVLQCLMLPWIFCLSCYQATKAHSLFLSLFFFRNKQCTGLLSRIANALSDKGVYAESSHTELRHIASECIQAEMKLITHRRSSGHLLGVLWFSCMRGIYLWETDSWICVII